MRISYKAVFQDYMYLKEHALCFQVHCQEEFLEVLYNGTNLSLRVLSFKEPECSNNGLTVSLSNNYYKQLA